MKKRRLTYIDDFLTFRFDHNGNKVLVWDPKTGNKSREDLQNELFDTSLTKSEKPVYESMYPPEERANQQRVYKKAFSKIDDIHKYDIYTNIARVARVALIVTGMCLTTKALIHGEHLIEATGDITNDNGWQITLYSVGTMLSGMGSSLLVNKFREKVVQAKHYASKCIDYLGGVKDSVKETIEKDRQEKLKDAKNLKKFIETNTDITSDYSEQSQTNHIDDIINILNKNRADHTIPVENNLSKQSQTNILESNEKE